MNHLIFLHGFLGDPDDWRPVIEQLPHDWRCSALDLNVPDPLLEAKSYLQAQTAPFFLIGYSMGGRIAWQLAPQLSSLQGLILLGAHPGLKQKEKAARWKSDCGWISLLEKGDMAAFLAAWYAQPLFTTLRNKEEVIAKRMRRDPFVAAEMLRRVSLANQKKLPRYAHTLFLHGAEDLKYAALYNDEAHVEAIPMAGHTAHLDHPQAVACAIRRFVEQDHDLA